MKIEFVLSKPSREQWHVLIGIASIVASIVTWVTLGFPTWLLLVAFCFLIIAIGLLWSSVTTVGQNDQVTLEEALDMAAPARDEERKLAVLRGIKDLEYERGLGKISEQDYMQLTQRYRREAKELLERLDTSEASLRQRAVDMVKDRLENLQPRTTPPSDSNA